MVRTAHKAGLGALTLTALGVVYGDLGTSPLYTLKTVLDLAGGTTPTTILGLLSVLVWTLLIITSFKYVLVAMRIDNDGEGGILALMSLIGIKKAQHAWVVALGLLGAALIYGDGTITPAISVLSALEGLTITTSAFTPYVLPLTVVILALLFLAQPFGTASIGRLFGPIMTLWFIVIGALGIWGVAQYPAVFQALNPLLGIQFMIHGGLAGFIVLGGVFLCVTGAEALYADMGHIGARPIRLAWYGLVLPSLVLNYFGQGAILLAGTKASDNIFFQLCPHALLIPMVVLATVATIIASQAIITGAFSMTRQAIQLGWGPRMHITQTSSAGDGQIYVGTVNWLMMIVTIGLALAFRKSDNLAAAYGIAVSLTMFFTSCLLFVAMREVWGWSIWAAGALAGFFALIDITFAAANAMKILDGGWVPLMLAAIVFGLMWTWHRGIAAVSSALKVKTMPIADFLKDIADREVPRVPGTAVFLTRTTEGTPPVLLWHVKNNRALHKFIVAFNIQVKPIPWVDPDNRLAVEKLGENFWRITVRYGFMERPDLPAVIAEAEQHHYCTLQLNDVTYYVGHETVMHRLDGHGLPIWLEAIFAFMLRNSAHTIGFFNLPNEDVVEIGRQIEI